MSLQKHCSNFCYLMVMLSDGNCSLIFFYFGLQSKILLSNYMPLILLLATRVSWRALYPLFLMLSCFCAAVSDLLCIFKIRDFDVRLYLCNGAFEFITFDVFERLTANLVFPLYAITHAVLLILVCVATLQILRWVLIKFLSYWIWANKRQ